MARTPAFRPVFLSCLVIGMFCAAPATIRGAELAYSSKLLRTRVDIERSIGVSKVEVMDKGYARLAETGAPELPYRVVNFLLPRGEKVASYEFTASPPVELLRNADVQPAPAMVAEDGTVGESAPLATRSATNDFPARHGRYLGTGYLHGRAIASFAVFPLRVSNGKLLLSESIDVRVTTEPGVDQDVTIRERYRDRFDAQLERTLAQLVVNPEMNARYAFNEVRVKKPKGGFQPTSYPSLEGSAVDYLIITRDSLASVYQRLADYKTAKGVPTVVRTVEWIEANTRHGVDLPETMRFFVQDAYAKWGITYVLLGGDTDIIPPRYALSRFYQGGTELPVDMYFGCLDGSWNDTHDGFWGEGVNIVPFDNPDLYPEVYNGRIPISDAATTNVVIDKIISYEAAENRGYYDRYLFLAEVLFPIDWPKTPVISLNGADFSEFLAATSLLGVPLDMVRMYETEWLYAGSVHESRQNAIDSLNAGFNHVNHVGHGFRFNMSVGDASILNADADALTNNGKWFNLYMLNCTAAAFDFFCLGEHYLRNASGGAVSVVGSNESAFPNAAGNYMNEYYDLIFQQDVVHIGEAFARSRLPRTPIAESSDNVDLWTHYIYSILADPEMPFFTGVVDTAVVAHVANVGLGTTNILVNVTANGLPVDSAVVCLSKGFDDYEVAATDPSGNAVLSFTAESPGSISVVVSGLNLALKKTYIVVDPSVGGYLSFSGLVADDDSIGGTAGNGDGVLDAGETVDFSVSVTNSGSAPASGVTLVLRTQDPLVTIIDSTAVVGSVAAGGTSTATDPVRVMFDASLADEAVVSFDLVATDDASNSWADSFKKQVHAPRLELVMLRIDDSAAGNGDGVVQDGEEFRLYYGIKNFGTGAANGLTSALTDISGAFVLLDSTDVYPDAPAQAPVENTAGFRLQEPSTATANPLRVVVTDGFGRALVDTIELRPPDAPSSLFFDASLGVDRLEVQWLKSTAPDVAHYNVYQSPTAGGPYTRVNLDLIDHAVFLATGLSPSTRYYYVATAVDSSGNESAFSGEYSASTNAPQMPGFPIQLATQTPSSPAVGDIDGDGDLEIVVGNKHVYAWHHDGQEIRDGDGDPQSWGVLNLLGDDFASAIALARIDGNPGLDIVAADFGTKEVFVMDSNGAVLSGWPRTGEFGFRATPVAGDIDGDGILEIICVDDFGTLYVWRSDGTEYRDGDGDPATDGVFFRPSPVGVNHMSPALCDIDGDGKDEIILGTRMSKVHAFNEDGTEVPGWPFALPSEIAGSIVAGDIDNDGSPEIVARARTAETYLLNADGTVSSGWPKFVTINNPFFAGAPALADFDGDGKLEIVFFSNNGAQSSIVIKTWQGGNFPGWPLVISNSDASESTPTVADVDGDGSLDIVFGDESRFIYAWDLSGNLLDGFPIQVGDAVRATPVLTDVDLDGDLDMVLYSWDMNVYLYDLTAPYVPGMAPWPTLQGNVNRNGKPDFTVVTGIGNAAFSFDVGRHGVDLTWFLGAPDGQRYAIDRSVSTADGAPRGFSNVVTNMAADPEGALHFRDGGAEMGVRYIYRLRSEDNPDDVALTQPIYVPVSRAGLGQNHPNPFNPSTEITYFVPEGAARTVSLTVYDVTGARVRTLVDGKQTAGRFVVRWNGRNDRGNPIGSGVYFYRLRMRGFTDTKKMVFLK